ncbi:MAG: ABC transporter permease [Ardenticatenia bacterium]|nr:ABC transporter permease [Ardenticatenia bacterium]
MQDTIHLSRCRRVGAAGARLVSGSWLRAVSRPWLRLEVLFLPLALVLLVVGWQALVWITGYPAFILPSPADVAAVGVRVIANGTLWNHMRVTLSEVGAGLVLGLLAASLLGYPLAKSRRLERLAAPYLVVSQSVPVVAIAPLLIIWFGSGRLSKVLVCALIVFFPLLVNIMVGIRSVEEELRELMRSLQASRWQTFRLLEVPSALPVLLGGLRIGVTLSVVGAVVGELVGADRGLGFLINQGRGLFDTPLVFVAIMALVAIAMVLYGAVMLLERRLLRWQG